MSDVVNPIYIPFSVHDYIHRNFWKDRDVLLNNRRNIRMFFSGAYRGYQGSGISKVLGKMERQEIVEIYRNHPNTTVISSQNQLDEVLKAEPSTKYYFVDQDHFRISPSQWLEVLSHVEVFLCPPGVVNPMSYNANEAIAMGAIPLINYPEWFHPILKDLNTCFSFSNKNELISRMDQIIALTHEELFLMRNNVLEYFDCYQSDTAFIRKISELDESQIITFVMNVEQEIRNNLMPGSVNVFTNGDY
jgi:hypothetical protein